MEGVFLLPIISINVIMLMFVSIWSSVGKQGDT